jgi:hypothetical protein
MRSKNLTIIVITLIIGILGGLALAALLGIDSPAEPANTDSYTLSDIYNRLNDGTAGSKSIFTEPVSGPGTTMHDLNEIMVLAPAADNVNGATAADVYKGKTFWCLRSDGTWGQQTGTLIPSRFHNNGNGTFTDNQTGLMWLENANYSGNTMSWDDAIAYCNSLNIGGIGWRLPTILELESLIDANNSSPALPTGHPFINVMSWWYWSDSQGPQDKAWLFNMDDGMKHADFKYNLAYVWSVRPGW